MFTKKVENKKKVRIQKGRVMKKGMMMTAARYTTFSKRRETEKIGFFFTKALLYSPSLLSLLAS